MDILNISVRALVGEYRLSFVGPFGEFLEQFARGGERHRYWMGIAIKDRLSYTFEFEGDGLKGYINGDGIPQIEEAPSFEEAWMVMALGGKTSADKAELERRFHRHEREIRLLAEGWHPGLNESVSTILHNEWMKLMQKAWEYDKESPFADGYCSAAPRVFQLLTGRTYPVSYCY